MPLPLRPIRLIQATVIAVVGGVAMSTGAGQAQPAVKLPPVSGVFDYQLGGAYDRLPDGQPIDVVVRDATEQPLAGAYNICYVNGFQTQADQAEEWGRRRALLLRDRHGQPVTDPNWPDEFILDPSTPAQRAGILQILGPVIQQCAHKGFKAVEIDNLDTFTRFDAIARADAIALAQAYALIAHEAGLAIAQKNTEELLAIGRQTLGFDFAITESCAPHNHCQAFTEAYGPHVLQIEYPQTLDDQGLSFPLACNSPGRAPLTILRDHDLTGVQSYAHQYAQCAQTQGITVERERPIPRAAQ